VSADNPRATAGLLLAAAGRGEAEAQTMLGQILLEGHGIARDAKLAFTWFGIAARQGHAMALNMLGPLPGTRLGLQRRSVRRPWLLPTCRRAGAGLGHV
jgi:TPR repeat protein